MTSIKKILLMIFLLGSLVLESNGQYVLPQDFMADNHNGTMQIRWEPSSHSEWEDAKIQGYDLAISKSIGGINTVVHTQNIKPQNPDFWQSKIAEDGNPDSKFYLSVRDVLYPDQATDFILEEFMSKVIGNTQEKTDSFAINLISYYSIYDMDIAQSAAMGYTWDLPQDGVYKILLKVSGHPERSIEIDTRIPAESNSIKLDSDFGNREVKLSWDSKEFIDKVFGFYLEKSEDGILYKDMTELPLILQSPEAADTLSTVYTSYPDSLVENYKNYYYRIKTIDFFGNVSSSLGSTSGYGYQKMLYSPLIKMAEQKNENKAYLNWEIQPIDEPLVSHFRLMRADSTSGAYTIAQDSIDNLQRELYHEMEYTENYFRIEAVPIDGEALSSISVFVMGIDTVAPATPTVLEYKIDSLGRVKLAWNANQEPDLWGYRIFRANFADQEYALINAIPTLDTVFIDSVTLDLNLERVYYKILAADRRNNRSEFTDVIEIVRPDDKAPLQAYITKLSQQSDSIQIDWSRSTSRDVIMHRLYRRDIDREPRWTLIANLDSSQYGIPYIDTGLKYDSKYAYTLVAIDDTNLESPPSDLKMIYLQKPVEEFVAIREVIASFDEKQNKVKIEWEVNASEDIDYFILYRGWTKETIGKHEFIDASINLFEESIEDYKKVYYKFRPIYKSGRGNYFSDILEVEIKKG